MIRILITLLALLPIAGFVGSILIPQKWERTIFAVALSAILLEFVTFCFVGYRWLTDGFAPISTTVGSLYTSSHYAFSLSFYFDKAAAVFLGMALVMTTLVFIFSKYYLHREQGFKRFYATVLLFFTGLAFIILAGNFEVLFVGWELIGMSSVLLIAFYRDRFLPARNALKVFSVYRIADAFLLLTIWYAHHLFEKNVTFSELSGLVAHHGNHVALLGVFILIVAMIKSAQFPFSYWLPRAMEGPTTSSAIFYGALSVHMGLYLLLRTYPLWQGSVGVRITLAVVGLVTAIAASSIARVQSSVKTQIAYASITQIGIMFIELAAGLQWLVLLHFVSNASLRTYQLLISPSIVGYLVHDQFFTFVPPVHKVKNTLLGKIRGTLYVLGIKEWNMNTAVSHYFWQPLKFIGRTVAFLDNRIVQLMLLVLLLAGSRTALLTTVAESSLTTLSTIAVLVSIVLYIRAYTVKQKATTCWNLIMLGNLFGLLFLATAATWNWTYIGMYLAGIIAAFVAGHVCLWYLQARGESNTLQSYQGSIYAFPKLGQTFFVAVLLFMAFPISSSFLAQDILLSLLKGGYYQVALFCVSYLLVGVCTMRLYTKLFFGPHQTSYHEKAYRSS